MTYLKSGVKDCQFVFTFLALLLTSSVGCVTTVHKPHDYEIAEPPKTRTEVFVENPELRKELRILRRSKLYVLSKDRSLATHVELHKLSYDHVYCGMPLLPAIYTLGILPGYVPQSNTFTYTLRTESTKQTNRLVLPTVDCSWSLWGWFFKPFNSESRLLGRLVRTEALKAPEKRLRNNHAWNSNQPPFDKLWQEGVAEEQP